MVKTLYINAVVPTEFNMSDIKKVSHNTRWQCWVFTISISANSKIVEYFCWVLSFTLFSFLQTVYGEIMTLQNNSDVLGLSRFIVHRFLHSPEVSAKYSLPTVRNYYKKGKYILQNLLKQ